MKTSWLFAALSLLGPAIHAAEGFSEQCVTNGVTFALRGTAETKQMGFFNRYNAALYLPEDVNPEKALENVPKRLEWIYFAETDRKELIKNAGNGIAKLPPKSRQELSERVEQLHAAYESVKPGDRYSLTYIPGRGTELALNGISKMKVHGADFAGAYFGIWLGSNTPEPEVRDALLGRPKK